jgi:23S rRNA (uridine2552-2'-O)-methyltransferase
VSRPKRLQDSYGRRARREGYPARSVYKLEEIDRRTRLLRPGQRVLDLGAAPGSWTLYAAERVGKNGRVVAIDLQEHRGELPPHVEFRTANVLELDETAFDCTFDVVMSDMAPSTTGQRSVDQYRSFELVMAAAEIADRVLKAGGTFVAKIFQGPDFTAAKKKLAASYTTVRVIRPEATRKESYEVFLIGLGKKS